jgi:hypothetical protein
MAMEDTIHKIQTMASSIALSQVCKETFNLRDKNLNFSPPRLRGGDRHHKNPQHHIRVAGLIGHTVISTVAKNRNEMIP